jgi:hypothetical protein
MKWTFPLALALSALVISGCASPQAAGAQRFAQTAASQSNPFDPSACPSKWVAAGNNGAKADRYFQPGC